MQIIRGQFDIELEDSTESSIRLTDGSRQYPKDCPWFHETYVWNIRLNKRASRMPPGTSEKLDFIVTTLVLMVFHDTSIMDRTMTKVLKATSIINENIIRIFISSK